MNVMIVISTHICKNITSSTEKYQFPGVKIWFMRE